MRQGHLKKELRLDIINIRDQHLYITCLYLKPNLFGPWYHCCQCWMQVNWQTIGYS